MSTNEDPTSITPLFKPEHSLEPDDSVGVIKTQPAKIAKEEEDRKAIVFENGTPQKSYSNSIASWLQCYQCLSQCCECWVSFLPWLVTGCDGGCIECLNSTCECFTECLPLCGECCVSFSECCR